jgi:hypothetical protein
MGEPITVRGRRASPIPLIGWTGAARPIPVLGAARPIPVVGAAHALGYQGPSCDSPSGVSRRYGETAEAFDNRARMCDAEMAAYAAGGGGIVDDESYDFDWNLLASTWLQYEQIRRMSDSQRRGLVDAYRGGATPDELRLMASARGKNTLLYIALAFLGYKVITAKK